MAVRIALGALLATLVGGCGGSATRTSGGAPHATTATASATTSAAAVPPGFARYHGDGFTFLAPSGFRPARNGVVTGLPRGASAEILTPGGGRVESTNAQIIEGFNPRLRTDVNLDQVATSLEAADRRDPAVKQLHTNLSAMTVNGAAEVRVVTESYIGPGGGRTRTLFHRTWLMVLPRPGLLLDLVVVDEPQRGGALAPTTVLDSFRLDAPGG